MKNEIFTKTIVVLLILFSTLRADHPFHPTFIGRSTPAIFGSLSSCHIPHYFTGPFGRDRVCPWFIQWLYWSYILRAMLFHIGSQSSRIRRKRMPIKLATEMRHSHIIRKGTSKSWIWEPNFSFSAHVLWIRINSVPHGLNKEEHIDQTVGSPKYPLKVSRGRHVIDRSTCLQCAICSSVLTLLESEFLPWELASPAIKRAMKWKTQSIINIHTITENHPFLRPLTFFNNTSSYHISFMIRGWTSVLAMVLILEKPRKLRREARPHEIYSNSTIALAMAICAHSSLRDVCVVPLTLNVYRVRIDFGWAPDNAQKITNPPKFDPYPLFHPDSDSKFHNEKLWVNSWFYPGGLENSVWLWQWNVIQASDSLANLICMNDLHRFWICGVGGRRYFAGG